MGQLMLLNPRRKTTAQKTKTRRSPARAARPRRSTVRATSPRRHRSSVRAASPRRRRSSRRAKGFDIKNIVNSAVPAAIGGAGALALDVAFGLLPIPDALKTGTLAPVAKLGGAVALGFIGRKIAGPKIGDQVLVGAITVASYSFLKSLLQKTMPNVPLGDYGYPSLGYVQAGQYLPGADLVPQGGYLPTPTNYGGADLTTPGGYAPNAALNEYVSGMSEYVSGYGY